MKNISEQLIIRKKIINQTKFYNQLSVDFTGTCFLQKLALAKQWIWREILCQSPRSLSSFVKINSSWSVSI